MKRIALILAMLCMTIAAVKAQDKDYVIVIHGGAGNMTSMKNSPEQQEQYYAALEEASKAIIFGELSSDAGNGGLIAVDKYGNFTMDFNSSGMFRGYIYREKGSENYKGEVGILQEMRTIK